METIVENRIDCIHCGEQCTGEPVREGEGVFCCQGCRMVYQLLNRSGLCNYYQLNEHPGINQRMAVRKDKFVFLDDPAIIAGLVVFQNDEETHIRLYLPQIHCSSCLYLLEHLHRLEGGIVSSRVDFGAREAAIVFDQRRVSLRAVAELLTSLGYEPYISLHDMGQAKPAADRGMLYQLGVAGFCFANIMLISFPEYLGLDMSEAGILGAFRCLNLLVSLPVVFYSARPFYTSAWKALRHRWLNIDAPIVLAIGVTFSRSVYEVLSGTGSGYFDSMTGIIFFMLAGRVLQDRTYRQLSFDRDYTSYFPVAVTVVQTDKATGLEREVVKTMPDIRSGDTLRIHSEELIPADGILTRGKALIDYSFVTGESLPVEKQMGDLVYAGGKQTGSNIEVLVVKEVTQSYLTQLWNRQEKRDADGAAESKDAFFVHALSRWFTYIVLSIAIGAGLYWRLYDPAKVWNAVTAVLIVACPCALLLSSTFTHGNLLRILGRNHFYLRNAGVIERVASADHIVFDKTGTLTAAGSQIVTYKGETLSAMQRRLVATLAAQSMHPLSRLLAAVLKGEAMGVVTGFREIAGQGAEGFVDGLRVGLGSKAFLAGPGNPEGGKGTRVYIAIDGRLVGFYEFSNQYRKGVGSLASKLRGRVDISVLSGDNAREKEHLKELLGNEAFLVFNQTPRGKSRYIAHLQQTGQRVMMIGDGLNDAGALGQSDIGIALTEDCNNFTPASDAILRSDQLRRLPVFIRLCRAGKRIVLVSWIVSIIYNLAGISFAVSGGLSPMVAAILMPASSFTILLITYGSSNLVARLSGL